MYRALVVVPLSSAVPAIWLNANPAPAYGCRLRVCSGKIMPAMVNRRRFLSETSLVKKPDVSRSVNPPVVDMNAWSKLRYSPPFDLVMSHSAPTSGAPLDDVDAEE